MQQLHELCVGRCVFFVSRLLTVLGFSIELFHCFDGSDAPVVKCESPEFFPEGGHVTCSVKSNPTFQAKLLDEHGQEESRKTVTEQVKNF